VLWSAHIKLYKCLVRTVFVVLCVYLVHIVDIDSVCAKYHIFTIYLFFEAEIN